MPRLVAEKADLAAFSHQRSCTRKRKASQNVAVVDEAAKREIHNRWLNELEKDNFGDQTQELKELGVADDDEYIPDEDNEHDVVTSAKKSKKAGKNRNPMRASVAKSKDARKGMVKYNIQLHELWKVDDQQYKNIDAKPSKKAPRKFCSVCGFEAPYTCTRCRSRFCSLKCNHIHEETRCLKYTM